MLTAGQELAVLADPPDSRRGTHLSAESVNSSARKPSLVAGKEASNRNSQFGHP